MILPLFLGTLALALSMGIQVVAVVVMIRQMLRYLRTHDLHNRTGTNIRLLSLVITVLFVGNLVQILIWALLFMSLGEFSDIATAYYHSAVNFASLGYGDIVMSARWRLLGALEACNGVLMFGLTSGTLMTVMTWIFSRHKDLLPEITNNGDQGHL